MDEDGVLFTLSADSSGVEEALAGADEAAAAFGDTMDALASAVEASGAAIDAALGEVGAAISAMTASVGAALSSLSGVSGGADDAASALGGLDAASGSVAGAMDAAAASAAASAANLDALGGSADVAAAGLDTVGAAGDRAAPGLKAPGEHATSLADSMGKLTMPLALAGAAIAAVGVVSTKMAGDFQASMTALITGAGESSKNLDLVSNGILAMAAQTGESTKQLASGMYMIESAGYHGKAGLAVLQAAAEGAKVGNADLGTVADATTTILNDFGAKGVTAANAVNVLTATVSQGKTKLADLSSSLAQILPTASSANVGLHDVMAAMATMTGEGVPAANAATYLRQTILALDAPSKAAQKALASVGLSSTQVSAEMQTSLPGALQMITDAVGKKFPVGSAQYVAALKDIAGGSKQMQGMLDLTGEHMATFQQNVAGITASVKKGGSGITGWAQAQADFNTKLAQAGAAAQVVMIKLGEQLEVVAQAILAHVTPALEAMSAWISTHGKEAATIFEVLAVTIGGALVAALGVAAAAFIAANIAAIGIVAAVAAAAAVIAVLVLAFRNAYQHSAAFRAGLDAVMIPLRLLAAQLEAGLHKALVALGPVLQQVGNFLSQNLDAAMRAVLPSIMQAVKAIVDFDRAISQKAEPAIHNIQAAIEAAMPAIEAIWTPTWAFIKTYLAATWDVIKGIVQIAWSIVSGVIKVGLDLLGGNWKGAWEDMASSLSGVWAGIQSIVTGIGSALGGLAKLALTWGADLVRNLANGIAGAVGNVVHAVGTIANAISSHLHFSVPEKGPLASIKQWMPDMGKVLIDGMQAQENAIEAAARSMAGAVGAGFGTGLSGALGGVAAGAGLDMSGLGSLGGMSGQLAALGSGSLYSGATPGAGGGLSPLGLASLTAELQALRQTISRAAPLGAAPIPASLGAVTQNLGGVTFNGVSNIYDLYQQLNMLAGVAIENGGRGATAGLGL